MKGKKKGVQNILISKKGKETKRYGKIKRSDKFPQPFRRLGMFFFTKGRAIQHWGFQYQGACLKSETS